MSENVLCYSGDLFTLGEYQSFREEYPKIDRTMYGRGIIRNPGLLGEIKSGAKVSMEVLRDFHDKLYHDYAELFSGDKNVLVIYGRELCGFG